MNFFFLFEKNKMFANNNNNNNNNNIPYSRVGEIQKSMYNKRWYLGLPW